MKIAHFWSFWNWTLLILNFLVYSTIILSSIRKKFYQKLAMLTVMAGFCALVDIEAVIVGLTVNVDAYTGNLYTSHIKWVCYWSADVIGSILLVLLGIQIITEVIKLHYVVIAWATILSLVIGTIAIKLLPSNAVGNLLMFSTLASILTAVGLLMLGLVSSKEWPNGFSWVVAGIVTQVLLGAIGSILSAHLHTLVGVFNIGIPTVSLLGVCMYLVGVITSVQKQHGRT